MSRVKVAPTATILDFSGRLKAKEASNVEAAVRKAASIVPPFEHYATVGCLMATGGYPERHQLPYDLSAIDEVIDTLALIRASIINGANQVSNPEGDVIRPAQFLAL